MQKQTKIQATYSLTTAIAMIVGIVIGSGIYFKVDDILTFAGGNVLLGMFIIVLGSFAIIFGSLSMSELTLRHTERGGIFSYFERYIHPGLAAALGFFTAYAYLPSVIAIVAWVAANFTLGSGATLESQILLAVVYILALAVVNIYAKRVGGALQSLSTFVKVIPLLAIALVGLFWRGATPAIPEQLTAVELREVGWSWLSGLVPLYFAYDGWPIVTNIATEIKNPKKNLPRALVMGPLMILGLYLIFFYGLSRILGPTYIMTVGNDAVTHAATLIYGEGIGKLLLVVIIISVLGVCNGMLLAVMRLPQAFAERGWLKSEKLATIHPVYQLSVPSAWSVTLVTLAWLGIHYVVTKFNLLPGSDISEITVVFNNTAFIFLYWIVLSLYRKGEITNRFTGLVAPLLAMLSVVILLVGSLLTNLVMVCLFMLFCFLFCLLGFAIFKKNQK